MGFREKLRQWLGTTGEADDLPPHAALFDTLWGRDQERLHALGEYNAETYPKELAQLLARRQTVSEQLLKLNIADPDARIAAIPQLQQMLQAYPHPLAYETLIHAYLDAGRYDEARGTAFAARQRRAECLRSEHPEIRWEIEHLSDWTPEDLEQLRLRREAARR